VDAALGDERVEVVGVGEPVVGQVVAGRDGPAVGNREAVDPAVAGDAAEAGGYRSRRGPDDRAFS